MKSAIFLSVRNKARRLPGKTYAEIGGRPAIETLIDRLRLAREPDVIVLCTSTAEDDRRLLETAVRCGIEPFAGAEDDKLDRYLRATERFGIDFAAIVDGDDLFCEPMYIDRIICEHRERGGDYIVVDHLPLGATAFGVAANALGRVCAAKLETDTEVWGAYFTGPGFDVRRLEPDPEDRRPDLRLTLDYPEDLDFFRQVHAALTRSGGRPSLRAIIEYCDSHPEVVALNAGVQALYEANLRTAAPVRLGTTR